MKNVKRKIEKLPKKFKIFRKKLLSVVNTYVSPLTLKSNVVQLELTETKQLYNQFGKCMLIKKIPCKTVPQKKALCEV